MKRKAARDEALKNNQTPKESMGKDSYLTQVHHETNPTNRNSKHGRQGE
ncbi:hypothetical protein ABES80_11790 [Bacillus gobiensis]